MLLTLRIYFIPGDAGIIVNIDLNNWLIVLTILKSKYSKTHNFEC